MQAVSGISAQTYAPNTNFSSRTNSKAQRGPGFGVVDGGCCSGPCAIGCAGLLGLVVLPFLIKPVKGLFRLLSRGVSKAGNALKQEMK